MRRFGTLALAFAALAAGSQAAWAFRLPDANPIPLTEHQKQLRAAESEPQPYPMSYSEEAAKSLGVQGGKWDAFSTHSRDPFMPNLRGGIDGGRAMIGLQWRR
jgi:hypothetical protein